MSDASWSHPQHTCTHTPSLRLLTFRLLALRTAGMISVSASGDDTLYSPQYEALCCTPFSPVYGKEGNSSTSAAHPKRWENQSRFTGEEEEEEEEKEEGEQSKGGGGDGGGGGWKKETHIGFCREPDPWLKKSRCFCAQSDRRRKKNG